MPKQPVYEGIKAGDIIGLPEGTWYVEGVRYAIGSYEGNLTRIEGTYPDFQTDNLALNLRRVNWEAEDA